MAAHMDLDKRTRIAVKIPQRAVKDSPGRRFQGYLEPKEILSDEELTVRLAQYGYDGNVIQAARAIQTIESFVLAELANLLTTSPVASVIPSGWSNGQRHNLHSARTFRRTFSRY